MLRRTWLSRTTPTSCESPKPLASGLLPQVCHPRRRVVTLLTASRDLEDRDVLLHILQFLVRLRLRFRFLFQLHLLHFHICCLILRAIFNLKQDFLLPVNRSVVLLIFLIPSESAPFPSTFALSCEVHKLRPGLNTNRPVLCSY